MNTKIKQISFQKEFIPLIENGIKPVTRRIHTNLQKGDIAYFKAGRTGKKEGYIKILRVSKERLQDLYRDRGYYAIERELQREGIEGIEVEEGIIDFQNLWNRINKKENSWENDPEVYRIKFEYIGKEVKIKYGKLSTGEDVWLKEIKKEGK